MRITLDFFLFRNIIQYFSDKKYNLFKKTNYIHIALHNILDGYISVLFFIHLKYQSSCLISLRSTVIYFNLLYALHDHLHIRFVYMYEKFKFFNRCKNYIIKIMNTTNLYW